MKNEVKREMSSLYYEILDILRFSRTKLAFFVSDEQINEYYKNINPFYILGMGRSGTFFLSKLLNEYKNACVYHEPLHSDFKAIVDALKSEKKANQYINSFRKKYLYLKLKNKDINTYGEVNSNLRYHAKILKNNIPNVKILHLVRDGRDVVRSIMERNHYTEDGIGHHSLSPSKDDYYFDEWKNMSRFEKVCWLWKDANEVVEPFSDEMIKFERLINDYDYFNKKIELKLNINIGYDLWNNEVNSPKNITKKREFPHWDNWNKNQLEDFNEICGELMNKYGY